MIAMWLLRTLLVGLLLGVAALAAERVTGWFGGSRRWVWVAAMFGSIGIPLLALSTPAAVPELGFAGRWADRLAAPWVSGSNRVDGAPLEVFAAAAPAFSPIGEPVGAIEQQAGTPVIGSESAPPSGDPAGVSRPGSQVVAGVGTGSASGGPTPVQTLPLRASLFGPVQTLPLRALLFGWMLLSLGVLGFIVVGTARLRLLRDESTPVVIDGVPVRLSRGIGPAVIGLIRPEIVLPKWVLGTAAEERRLILAHEWEHVSAKDSWLLACGMLLLAAMPWNLPLWWQHRRLRLAVETDCDARVVANGASRRAYGQVLIRAASDAAVLPWLSPAWGETESHLERRILAITSRRPRYRHLLAVPLLAITLGIGAAACDVAQRGRTGSGPIPEATQPPARVATSPLSAVEAEAVSVDARERAVQARVLADTASALAVTRVGMVLPAEAAVAVQPARVSQLATSRLAVAPAAVARGHGALATPPRPAPAPVSPGRAAEALVAVIPSAVRTPAERETRAREAGLEWMRMNRRALEENGLEAAIADPTRYAWVVREGSGRVIRAGVERMPPEGTRWDNQVVERQLRGQLDGIRIRHIWVGAGTPLDEHGTRVNLVLITPRDATELSENVAPQGSRLYDVALRATELRAPHAQEADVVAVAPVSASATISGVITDPDGKPLVGASITLQPIRRGTVTNPEGRFLLFGIPPGKHTLVGVRPGTGRMIRREVEVEGGERQTIHIVF